MTKAPYAGQGYAAFVLLPVFHEALKGERFWPSSGSLLHEAQCLYQGFSYSLGPKA